MTRTLRQDRDGTQYRDGEYGRYGMDGRWCSWCNPRLNDGWTVWKKSRPSRQVYEEAVLAFYWDEPER